MVNRLDLVSSHSDQLARPSGGTTGSLELFVLLLGLRRNLAHGAGTGQQSARIQRKLSRWQAE